MFLILITAAETFFFGEYREHKFFGPFKTKATYEPTEELSNISAFGIFSDETIEFAFIPYGTFLRDVYKDGSVVPYREPKVGDVILTLWNDKAYEIADVGSENYIFKSKKMVHELILRPFRYSDQSDDATDISDADPFNIGDNGPSIDEMGDNDNIESESDEIYDYDEEDVDSSIYGY